MKYNKRLILKELTGLIIPLKQQLAWKNNGVALQRLNYGDSWVVIP
jgi:hypothetical protein